MKNNPDNTRPFTVSPISNITEESRTVTFDKTGKKVKIKTVVVEELDVGTYIQMISQIAMGIERTIVSQKELEKAKEELGVCLKQAEQVLIDERRTFNEAVEKENGKNNTGDVKPANK